MKETVATPLFDQVLPQWGWEIDSLADPAIRRRDWMRDNTKSRKYPARLLRYWFVYHFMRTAFARQATPLKVCEIGIDVGQMREFVRTASACHPQGSPQVGHWHGVDIKLKRDGLAGQGYDQLTEAGIDDVPGFLDPETDIVILLHILEHLYEPEASMQRLAAALKPGALVLGGLPSLPHFLVGTREAKIRANPNSNGHVSAFSPRRMRELAAHCGFELDFISGAFLARISGSWLEDQPWWLRFNLFFAQMFPAWPGETYWVLRKV